MMGACTLPRVLGFKKWFDARFGDLCESHDAMYDAAFPRKQADLILCSGVMIRGYPALAIAAYIVVRAFGWLHYNRKAAQHV